MLALALAACAWTNPKQVQAAFDEGVRAYDTGDFTAAYNAWLPLAKSGDLAAQRNIGHLYETGRGVPADPKEAAVWYRKAAEDGFSRAQANLANLYLKGEGVPQDDREAALWFHKAALQGHAVAQYNLGAMYEQGRGVERDPARALGWLMLAAKAGHPQAQEAVAKVMANPAPEGIPDSLKAEPRPAKSPPSKPAPEPPPPPQAAEPDSGSVTGFFRNLLGLEPAKPARPAQDKRSEAAPAPQPDPVPFAQAAVPPPPTLPEARLVRASSGDPVASGLAAYHGGQFHEAREAWEPLARRGDPLAQFYLGGLFRVGAGVPPDPVSAYLWWSLAARSGHQAAKEQLLDLTGEISLNELVEAERQLQAWRPER
jgi:TPR repeat protein